MMIILSLGLVVGRGSDGGGGGVPRPGEIEELNSRLNAKRSGRLTSSFIPSTEHDPDKNADIQDILHNRINRLCYGPSVPTSTENVLARRQQLRDNEIVQIPKELVNTRRGELFPDEFPSLPGPDFFEPPPVLLMIFLSVQMICQMCCKLLLLTNFLDL